MNEAIYFEIYEKSSSFGKLSFYSNKINTLSKNCGQLIISYEGHSERIYSMQWDQKLNELITASQDKTMKMWNFETVQ